MKNQRMRTVIVIGLLLLAVSCQAETSAPGTTTAVTPNTGPVEQTADGGLRARLEIPHRLPLGEPVKLQFFLVNDTGERLYVLNWFTPLEGLGGDIFRVTRDGEIVPYQGPLADRAEPTPDAYTLIEAGEAVWAEVDLTRTRAYDFSVPGNYTIKFNSPRFSHIARTEAEMAQSMDELGPIEIASNEVTVTIEDIDQSSADAEQPAELQPD